MPPSIPSSSGHEIARERRNNNIPKYNNNTKSVTFAEYYDNRKQEGATPNKSKQPASVSTPKRVVSNINDRKVNGVVTHEVKSRSNSSKKENNEQPVPITASHPDSEDETTATSSALAANTNSSALTPYDNNNAGLYGMGGGAGLYGGGAYGGGGLFGSPYGGYGGMMSPMMMMGGGYGMMGGPFYNLTQCLYGIQTVIFSLGQAVQIIGMNTEAMHQLFDSASAMVDKAISTYHEMRLLDEEETAKTEEQSEEEKMRRRRLRTLRYALVMASTYVGYKLLRRLIQMIFGARNKKHRYLMDGNNNHHHYGQSQQVQRYGPSYYQDGTNYYNNNSFNSGGYYHGGQMMSPSSYYMGSANSGMYGNGYY